MPDDPIVVKTPDRMLEKAFRSMLTIASQLQRRLMVVQFHRVLSSSDSLLESEPDVTRFESHVDWLAREFTILTVHEALKKLYAGKLPRRALSLTFDDGYRDNASNALPVLKRRGIRATFFVTTRFRDGGMMWNDRIIEAIRHWPSRELDLSYYGLDHIELPTDRALVLDKILMSIKYLPFAKREALADDLFARSQAPDRPMMLTANEIRELHSAGMEIGGHTDGHPILAQISDNEALQQIARNKAILEEIIGEPLTTFAYPNGRPGRDFQAHHCDMVRNVGYRYALTTAAGTATLSTDPYQVPRFTPPDRTHGRYIARLALNYFRDPEIVHA